MLRASIVLGGLFAISCPLVYADYPQFRGPNGNGIVEKADPPTTWSSTKNLYWSAKLPGSGWSQPVIVGKTVFVTSAVGDKLAKPKDMAAGVRDMSSMGLPGFGPKAPDTTIKWQLVALDAETGSIRWTQTVSEGKPQFPIHPSNTYATETACADAERVYVYFGATGTLAAYDHLGKVAWKIETGAYPFSNGFGSGSSPTLFEGKIYLSNFNEKKSFVAAFDAKTGQEAWRQPREKPGSAWASPFVWKNSKRTEIVACGDKLVTSHDLKTGQELWRFGGLDTGFAPSPASDGDLLIMGASSPFSASPLFCIKAGATGDITLKKKETASDFVAWFRTKGGVGMSSPVAAGGYLYIAGDSGLICVDTKTGVQKYKERLPKSRMVTACPVLIDGKILLLDEAGKATWVKSGPQFELLDTAEFPDTFWASPAINGDRVYLRGVDGLYCFKKS
jgi:outer membrane protein assembly factor BamB